MINLGSLKMPINAATKTFALLAKRGAGKSYTGAVLAEEFYKNNIPFVVFDPIDVWWGLRLAANGKDKGLPIVVFGLRHADIQLDRDMGRQIAQAIVRDNVSAVISTYGIPKVAQRHLIAEFSEEILNINNTPRHIFIEEAHEFVPQRVFGGLGKTFNAVSNLIVMGRNVGLGATLLNQRAATVSKDVLTQLDNLIAMRSVGPQDRKALQEWVEAKAAEGDFEQFIKSLPSLPTGEAWIWSPEFLNIFKKIEIRKRETFHPDREKIGDKFVMPQLDQMDVQSFIQKFNSEKPKETKKEKGQKKESIPLTPANLEVAATAIVDAEIIKMRNEFESQLITKDTEIRRLQTIITNAAKILGANTEAPIGIPLSAPVESLIDSLPKYEKEIILVIKPHPNFPFNRAQLAAKSGKSFTSSAFPRAIRRLIQLNLLHEQDNDLIYKN